MLVRLLLHAFIPIDELEISLAHFVRRVCNLYLCRGCLAGRGLFFTHITEVVDNSVVIGEVLLGIFAQRRAERRSRGSFRIPKKQIVR